MIQGLSSGGFVEWPRIVFWRRTEFRRVRFYQDAFRRHLPEGLALGTFPLQQEVIKYLRKKELSFSCLLVTVIADDVIKMGLEQENPSLVLFPIPECIQAL